MQARSDLVKKMNNHFSKSLSLIEEGSADNNAQIREEMKQFFICAEEIEKEINRNCFIISKKKLQNLKFHQSIKLVKVN